MIGSQEIRIGLDARAIFSQNRRGTAKNLIDLYDRIPALEPNWEYYLYCEPNNIALESIFLNVKGMKKREIDIRGYRFNAWEQIRLPIAALIDKINLLHSPANASPYYIPCAKVVTIHDLSPLKLDLGFLQSKIRAIQRNIQHSLKSAKKIITVSEYSKKDILDTFGKQYEDKIEVIYWAPQDNYHPIEDKNKINMIKNKYSINNRYIFAFSAYSTRKNPERLLESFSIFSKKTKENILLLIAGIESALLLSLKNLIEQLDIDKKVIFAGFVPEEDIPFLLSGAEFLIFIPLYEGFGLPPLDAMACDCPVIASNVTSIPEVVGDAGILVDPYNVNEIADAMVNLFGNNKLRNELINKGRGRIKHFSWDKTAKETVEVYREALGIRNK